MVDVTEPVPTALTAAILTVYTDPIVALGIMYELME